MTIEVTLERIAVALERLAGHQVAVVEAASTPRPAAVEAIVADTVAPAKARGRPRKQVVAEKAEAAAAKAIAAEATVVQAVEAEVKAAAPGISFLDDDTAAAGETPPTKDDVKSVLIRVQGKYDKDRAFALLAETGALSFSQLDPSKYAAVIAAGKKLLS